jgi:mono/diheme cytochrome c family protein
MRKALKWVVIVIAALLVVLAALALATNWLAERKRTRVIELTVAPLPYVSDAAAIERGKYLYESRGCMECHGSDGAGRDVVNDPEGMYVHSSNISPGPGSVVKAYTEADWVRAIRHGVSPQKHALFLMPSKDYSRLTDADLAAIIAYARNLPPATGGGATVPLPFVVKALYAAGAVKDDAEEIDHTLLPPAPVAETISVDHGAYVAKMCTGCHGDGLSGGKIPGAPPDWPPAANLTPGTGSAMVRYPSDAAFASMLRTGKRPDGTAVSRVMPFTTLGKLNDTDIGAVYVFLKALPPRPAGNR